MGETLRDEQTSVTRTPDGTPRPEPIRVAAEQEWQRFHDLLWQAPALICVLRGPEHVTTFANPPYRALVGGREVVGKPLREALPELEGQGIFELLDGVFRTGDPFLGQEIALQLDRHGDGRVEDGYFTFVYQPTRDADGEIDGIFVHAVDVTDQVQARQQVELLVYQLAAERDRLQVAAAERERAGQEAADGARQAALGADVGAALVSADPLGARLQRCAEALVRHLDAAFARIWTLDDAGTMLELHASAGLYTHLDGPHGRVPVGQYKIGQIALERRPHLTNHVVGDPRVGDQEWARREGMVAFAGYPLLVGGQLAGVLGLFAQQPLSDATLTRLASIADGVAVAIVEAKTARERDLLLKREQHARDEAERLLRAERAARADLRMQTEQLAAANRELEAFSYSVSHDLRAPLRAMDGFSRILIEDYADALPPEAQRYLGLVRDNARQMGELVDDLLAFSRLGRQALERRPLQMAPIARDAWTDLRHEWEGRPVDARIAELPTTEIPIAFGDSTLLRLVFQNLLGNALKFSRERTPAVIEVGAEERDGELAYFVRDNGVGFDMRYADKLFGVFQRLHRAEEYEGTGVGLAIVQRIVHRHGGRVWAESTAGQGATFSFTLGGAAAPDDQ